jgi:hypothetical protein
MHETGVVHRKKNRRVLVADEPVNVAVHAFDDAPFVEHPERGSDGATFMDVARCRQARLGGCLPGCRDELPDSDTRGHRLGRRHKQEEPRADKRGRATGRPRTTADRRRFPQPDKVAFDDEDPAKPRDRFPDSWEITAYGRDRLVVASRDEPWSNGKQAQRNGCFAVRLWGPRTPGTLPLPGVSH